MSEWVQSAAFGISLSVLAYWIGVKIQKKTGLAICNYIVIAIALVIAALMIFDIPYESYYIGGSIINAMLGPATVCLAVSIYQKIELLKKNWLPILLGCVVGSVTSIVSILLMCRMFGLDSVMTVSMLPKSVTTPIATAISEGQGGILAITVAAVTVTGISGNLMAPFMMKIFPIRDPMVVGLGLGACSHAVGTAKALELGETEGAVSSLAIGICGIITTLLALAFTYLV